MIKPSMFRVFVVGHKPGSSGFYLPGGSWNLIEAHRAARQYNRAVALAVGVGGIVYETAIIQQIYA